MSSTDAAGECVHISKCKPILDAAMTGTVPEVCYTYSLYFNRVTAAAVASDLLALNQFKTEIFV